MDLESLSTLPPCRMKFVPGFMKGSHRAAMRVALNAIDDEGRSLNSMLRISRGWRSFLDSSSVAPPQAPKGEGKDPEGSLAAKS